MGMPLIDNGIYIIPTSTESRHIVYSPLRGLLFWASTEAVEVINKHVNDGVDMTPGHEATFNNFSAMIEREEVFPRDRKITISDKAVIILTQKCNLACTYCYAQKARSSDTIDSSKLAAAIEHVLTGPSKKIKNFSFIGGGEPTIAWDLFEWAVEYIREKSKAYGVESRIGLATNATLLTEERAAWLKSNHVNVSVSFDVLPEIQNSQRCFPDKSLKSFDIVDAGIKLLLAYEIPARIRSTITSENVHLMKDMVAFVVERYPKIKRLHFEHVIGLEIEQSEYYNEFASQFFIARDVASANGIGLRNSITNSTNHIKSRFCGGEFCVTSSGDIVSCHRVSSSREDLFNIFAYGNINDTINIDSDALKKVEYFANKKLVQCTSCFAQWHCAGACIHARCLFSPEQSSLYCEFVKMMIAKDLESKLTF